MARFERTTEYWPLVVTIVPPRFSVADVDAYAAEVERTYARGEKFASLAVTSDDTTLPGRAERRRLADWQQASIEHIRALNVFHATVIRSPLARSGLTAMNWVFRPPNEQIVVATLEEGLERCLGALRASGLPFSEALERLERERPSDVRALFSSGAESRKSSTSR